MIWFLFFNHDLISLLFEYWTDLIQIGTSIWDTEYAFIVLATNDTVSTLQMESFLTEWLMYFVYLFIVYHLSGSFHIIYSLSRY